MHQSLKNCRWHELHRVHLNHFLEFLNYDCCKNNLTTTDQNLVDNEGSGVGEPPTIRQKYLDILDYVAILFFVKLTDFKY